MTTFLLDIGHSPQVSTCGIPHKTAKQLCLRNHLLLPAGGVPPADVDPFSSIASLRERRGCEVAPRPYGARDPRKVSACHIWSSDSVSFHPGMLPRPRATRHNAWPGSWRSADWYAAVVKSGDPGMAPLPSAPWQAAQAWEKISRPEAMAASSSQAKGLVFASTAASQE